MSESAQVKSFDNEMSACAATENHAEKSITLGTISQENMGLLCNSHYEMLCRC